MHTNSLVLTFLGNPLEIHIIHIKYQSFFKKCIYMPLLFPNICCKNCKSHWSIWNIYLLTLCHFNDISTCQWHSQWHQCNHYDLILCHHLWHHISVQILKSPGHSCLHLHAGQAPEAPGLRGRGHRPQLRHRPAWTTRGRSWSKPSTSPPTWSMPAWSSSTASGSCCWLSWGRRASSCCRLRSWFTTSGSVRRSCTGSRTRYVGHAHLKGATPPNSQPVYNMYVYVLYPR